MSEIFSKILKDKNGKKLNVGSKYTQPEWGEDKTIVDIMPETTFEASEDMGGMAPITNSLLYTLVGGAAYEVIYNGISYNCICYDFNDGREGSGQLILGNAQAAIEDAPATDDPFLVAIFYGASLEESGVPGMAVPLDGSTSFTLSIKGASNEVRAIPAKYVEHAPVAPLIVTPNFLNSTTGSSSHTFDAIYNAIISGRKVFVKPYYNDLKDVIFYFSGMASDCIIFTFFDKLPEDVTATKSVVWQIVFTKVEDQTFVRLYSRMVGLTNT